MPQTMRHETPAAVRRALPAAHQVAFRAATDSDTAQAWNYLLAELDRAGCTSASMPDGLASSASIGLPGGGTAILAVGKAAGPLAGPGCLTAGITITDPGRSTGGELSTILAVLDSLPLTGWELSRVREQMPVTADIVNALGPSVFADMAVLCAIHHMRDFTAMASALIACGARPELITIIDKGYPYLMRDRVDGWLRHRLGATVVPYPSRIEGIRGHLDRAAAVGARTLVFDDGGYVLPAILDHMPSRADEIAGVIEQNHVRHLEDRALRQHPGPGLLRRRVRPQGSGRGPVRRVRRRERRDQHAPRRAMGRPPCAGARIRAARPTGRPAAARRAPDASGRLRPSRQRWSPHR